MRLTLLYVYTNSVTKYYTTMLRYVNLTALCYGNCFLTGTACMYYVLLRVLTFVVIYYYYVIDLACIIVCSSTFVLYSRYTLKQWKV